MLQKRIPFKGIALTPLDRHSCAIKDVNVVVGVDICVESGREKIAESVGNADLVVAHLVNNMLLSNISQEITRGLKDKDLRKHWSVN